MECCKTCLGGFVIGIVILIGSGIIFSHNILQLVIAQDSRDSKCDANATVRLSTWLIVDASLMFSYLLCIIFVMCHEVLGGVWALLITLVKFAWLILGAYVLFVQTHDCFDESRPTYTMWCYTLWSLTANLNVIIVIIGKGINVTGDNKNVEFDS